MPCRPRPESEIYEMCGRSRSSRRRRCDRLSSLRATTNAIRQASPVFRLYHPYSDRRRSRPVCEQKRKCRKFPRGLTRKKLRRKKITRAVFRVTSLHFCRPITKNAGSTICLVELHRPIATYAKLNSFENRYILDSIFVFSNLNVLALSNMKFIRQIMIAEAIINGNALWRYVEQHSPAIEEALRESLPLAPGAIETRFNEAVEYSAFPGGKRLRPVLTLLGAELLAEGDRSFTRRHSGRVYSYEFAYIRRSARDGRFGGASRQTFAA